MAFGRPKMLDATVAPVTPEYLRESHAHNLQNHTIGDANICPNVRAALKAGQRHSRPARRTCTRVELGRPAAVSAGRLFR